MRGRSAWLRLRRDSGTTEASATPGVAWLAQVAGDRSGFTSIKTSAATATPIQLLTPRSSSSRRWRLRGLSRQVPIT
jgi:hypothetical protein